MYYVCSNCGNSCGVDSRMGALDYYLACRCASPENSHWINDGRGGYMIYLNNAHPIPIEEYNSKFSSSNSGWICSRCRRSNAPHVTTCQCT